MYSERENNTLNYNKQNQKVVAQSKVKSNKVSVNKKKEKLFFNSEYYFNTIILESFMELYPKVLNMEINENKKHSWLTYIGISVYK